jgi:hypothetical protein
MCFHSAYFIYIKWSIKIIFLLLAAVRTSTCLQGACAGHLHTSPQHRHPAYGHRQGVLAPCALADGARCWVSVLNTWNFQFSGLCHCHLQDFCCPKVLTFSPVHTFHSPCAVCTKGSLLLVLSQNKIWNWPPFIPVHVIATCVKETVQYWSRVFGWNLIPILIFKTYTLNLF